MKEFKYSCICHEELDFEKTMLGQTFCNVERGVIETEGTLNECLLFMTKGDTVYLMFHEQDCSESVVIEDICGDLDDLKLSPIVKAICVNNKQLKKYDSDDVLEWTFYHLSTVKGTVTIRWFGTSNGYYATTAELYKVDSEEQLRRTVVT